MSAFIVIAFMAFVLMIELIEKGAVALGCHPSFSIYLIFLIGLCTFFAFQLISNDEKLFRRNKWKTK